MAANKLITNLSGGMNTKVSPILLKDSECELIVNYNLDTVGALTKRNGYDVFASQPVAGKRVVGLYQYTNISTTSETTQIMVANSAADANTVIYYNNAGTWTTSKSDTAITTWTNFNRYRFAVLGDYLYRVNGTSVVATSNNVNGASWGTTAAPATITPSFIKVFADRMYLARNGTALASRVYFSTPTTAGFPVSWDIATTSGYFDVNLDDGDEITALENNGNRLLIFKRFSMYRWTYGISEPDRLIGLGTHSQECVKTNFDLGITFFANEYGAYAYTGDRPKLISRKIQKWFEAIPAADLDDMCAETDADHYYLYLSDSMTVDGITYTNVMAVYTVSLDAWTIYSLNTPVRVMNKLIQSGAEDIYFGSSNGRTYKWNSGTADDSSGTDSNTATDIHTEVIFKEHLLTYPLRTNITDIDILARDSMKAKVGYQIDRSGDFKPLRGALSNRYNNYRIGDSGRSIRIRVSESSQVQSVLEGYNIEHNPLKDRG